MTTTNPLTAVPGWTPPEAFEPSPTAVLDVYDKVLRGDWVGVTLALGNMDLTVSAYEMNRLSTLADHYGPLESGADSLSAILQAHTKDGSLGPLSDSQVKFLNEAVAVFNALGKPVPGEILMLISKIKSGESISQEEATKLYGWCADAKLVTIPRTVSNEQLAQLAKGTKERHDGLLNKINGGIKGWTPAIG